MSVVATSFGFVDAGIGSSFSAPVPAVLPDIWISADGMTWRRINVDVIHSAPSRIAFIMVVAHGRGAAPIARQFEARAGRT